MMHEYFQYVSRTMAIESEMILSFYKHHHGKLGEAREILLQRFLSNYLPKRFGVGSGFALLTEGNVSTEQDVIIYDNFNSPVFFSEYRSAVFPPSTIQCLIEVKSSLNKTVIEETIQKTKIVKQEMRKVPSLPVSSSTSSIETLVCLFAYAAPNLKALKSRIISLQNDIKEEDRLDLVCILGKGVIASGSYFNIATFGEPNSEYARSMSREQKDEILTTYPDKVKCYQLGNDSLLVFYHWLLSYISRRPAMLPDLINYAPPGYNWGSEC